MRAAAIIVGLLVVVASGWAQGDTAPQRTAELQPEEGFSQALRKLADFSPDPCGPPFGREENWHTSPVEAQLFERAADVVIHALNAAPTDANPEGGATRALQTLVAMSTEINAAWPEANRFHFEVLDLAPALVVKMTARTQARFYVFAKADSGKAAGQWLDVDSGGFVGDAPRIDLDLLPLQRGPSGNPRFLAKFIRLGCAGSLGVEYDAREWNPGVTYGLQGIIKQEGAFGLDDKVPGFEQIGEFKTDGPLITLPYCWFSGIDTWDNPSLCAVDTYDVSGDDVRFLSRTYNRPDLLPVAKAIEYAEKRERDALRAYCDSDQLASKMVREFPPYVFADELRVVFTGSGTERVEMGFDPVFQFDVENRNGLWLLVGFRQVE